MNGLKVYINPDDAVAPGSRRVFYSCREGGPYYRWCYETGLGQWLFSRVRPVELTPRSLCLAKWSVVPKALQTRMNEHYLE